MNSSDKKPSLRGRTLLLATACVVLIGAGVWALFHFRSAPPTPTPMSALAELSRHELQFTNGHAYRRGETKLFTGLMTESYTQGGLRSRSAISNGLLNGVSRGWHTNGPLQVEEHFVNGVSHGPRTRWFADGTKESEATIVHGVIEGVFRKWHPNGALAQEITLSNGVPHGLSRAFAPDGALKNEVRLSHGVAAKDSTPL